MLRKSYKVLKRTLQYQFLAASPPSIFALRIDPHITSRIEPGIVDKIRRTSCLSYGQWFFSGLVDKFTSARWLGF
jgi:hypothetical protein